MAPIGSAVFATLLMNDAYLPGAMVLGHSLKDRGAKGKLVVLVVVDKLAASTISELKTVYDDIVPVRQIMNKAPANLYLMNRPDLVGAFTKIELWRQTQYKRIVYIDADVVALRTPNELLTMDTEFAAVPDIGWPDCFNSGVMVLNPNLADYYAMLALAERGISFDGADQGLLNMHFTDWERLSFKYNCTPSGNYQYVPAYRHFQSTINLVHFIGREKPWTLGRESKYNAGVYGELLGRWWTVYDRYYRARQTVYYEGQWQSAPKKVQDYVFGEETMYLPAYQASQRGPPTLEDGSPPALEQPMGDQPSVVEQIASEAYEPTPTVEQRRWSAPHAEWEPTKAPPPVNSKPEASNFPSQIYDFSDDTKLFRPPGQYPEAPKDMWYEVPKKVALSPKPNPIFPWEERAPKPTRVFAEPVLPSPAPEPPVLEPASESETEAEREASSTTGGSTTTDQTDAADASIGDSKAPYMSAWETFNQRTNAWDDMPEITRYVQALQPPRRGKIQVLHHTPSTSIGGLGDLSSPTGPSDRRPSLKLTDFPTAIERPSLPVTPAPIRRPSFWGEEKDMSGELPNAQGVPIQDEWNPIAKLDELQRRQSQALLGMENMTPIKEAPKRDLPESASREAVEAAVEKATSPTSTRPLKPILKEPHFELSKQSDSTDGAVSSVAVHESATEEILSPDEPGKSASNTPTPSQEISG